MTNSNKFSYFTSGKFRKDIYPKKMAFRSYNLSKLSKVIATYRNKQTHLEDFYEQQQNSSFEYEVYSNGSFYCSDEDSYSYLSDDSLSCPCCQDYEYVDDEYD